MGIKNTNNIKIKFYSGRHDNSIIDINDVIKLNNNELGEMDGSKGFMIYPFNQRDLTIDILSKFILNDGKLITLRDSKGKLEGFILYDILSKEKLSQIEELNMINNYINVDEDKTIFIQKILVAKESRKKGIAQQLLNMSINENKEAKYIASSVVCSPEYNEASMNFHYKNNFKDLYETEVSPPDYSNNEDIPHIKSKITPFNTPVREKVLLKTLF